MPDVTLHLKAQITSRECAVCGTRLDRSDRDHWWLRNTWTSSAVQDYYEGGGCMPTDWFRPCGRLPAEYGKTPNVGGEERLAAHQPSQTTTATPQGVASTDQLGGRVRSEKDDE